MLGRIAVGVVGWCWRRAWWVAAATVVATLLLGWFAATHLDLDTDESKLISPHLPFRQAEKKMDAAFPQDSDLLVAVVDAPTPERAEAAVRRLQDALTDRHDLFLSVRRPVEESFFRSHGLLFMSTDELTELSDRLAGAQPLLGTLARDPSLRGLLASVDMALGGVERGQAQLSDLAPLLDSLDSEAAAVAAGRPTPPLSWQNLFAGDKTHDQPRRFLLTQPILHYGDLEAGGAATSAIRDAAAHLGDPDVTVRVTGSVALTDANFSTVTQGLSISGPLSVLAVVVLLFLAVRSFRVVMVILASLLIGLTITAAFAAATVGTLNPISVAFFVLFVGIAVDFAIQFVVRFRDERHGDPEPNQAMLRTARGMAVPLCVAGLATAVGFLSFLPTDYTGVSQLGLIAGAGMLIALVVDFTVLPALLAVAGCAPERHEVALPLEKADSFLARHARGVVAGAAALAVVGAALLTVLPEDFNPLDLQDPKAEAVSTFRDLMTDPDNGSYAIDLLAPNLKAAQTLADKLDPLPEVRRTMTLATFVPDDQDAKLVIINDLDNLLGATLNVDPVAPPTGEDLVAALNATAARLDKVAGKEAQAEHLKQVAEKGPKAAEALQSALITGLPEQLRMLRAMLNTEPVTMDSLPPALKAAWVSADGRARVQVLPKGDMEDPQAMDRFVKAVRDLAPDATGLPVSIQQSGAVVTQAFSRAGTTALIAIAILLGVVLRRLLDAVLVVLPLVMGALYTVICMVAGGLAINFANIIALPLLLGIGVAFNIYFVVNWRQGKTNHLASATARAVLFSSLTTGSAFGSLAMSPHLGTSSMGVLLSLSLGLSVVTTFVVMPALFHVLDRRTRQ